MGRSSTEQSIASLIDYPLADCYFDNSAQWVVINRTNLFSEKENIAIITRAQDIEHIKESLVLTTFPVGRGTTPEGYLYVYKNGVLVKDVPYLSCTISDPVLQRAFRPATMQEAEVLIGAKLPPVV